MATLKLSDVPASIVVGSDTTVIKVSGPNTSSWTLSSSPPGVTFTPATAAAATAGVQIKIEATIAGPFTITLTPSDPNDSVVGSPFTTVAINPAVNRYLELLADLEPLKF
jgi:hypothetical protein